MREFEYAAWAARVVFGPGAARTRLAEHVDGRRVLVIATAQEADLAAELSAPFQDRVAATFTGVRPHVPVEVAQTARDAARGADAILSIGGGSTTGTAKAVALTAGLPIVAVPTTYAGSEVTPVWGLTEGGVKTTGKDPRVLPKVVVYDPQLTVTLPRELAVASGLNALAHCVEAFWAPGANPVTSLLAEEGIRALAASIPRATRSPRDLEARSEALYGAYLAGTALSSATMALHHKLCHTVGGTFDLPHAEVHTVILPHAARYNAAAAPEAMARVARALGVDDAPAGLFDFARSLEVPTSLEAIGMREQDLDRAADLAAQNPYPNPRPIERAALRTLLDDAFHGRRPT
jgi:maleylacetate reductase